MGSHGVSARGLAARASTRLGLEQRTVDRIVDELVDQIASAVAAGEKVNLRGFGVFEPRVTAERQRRQPGTGAPITVPARRTVAFFTSKSYKTRLNARPR